MSEPVNVRRVNVENESDLYSHIEITLSNGVTFTYTASRVETGADETHSITMHKQTRYDRPFVPSVNVDVRTGENTHVNAYGTLDPSGTWYDMSTLVNCLAENERLHTQVADLQRTCANLQQTVGSFLDLANEANETLAPRVRSGLCITCDNTVMGDTVKCSSC